MKYVIVDGEYDVPSNYSLFFEGMSTTVYENPNALSLAYAVNSSVKDLTLAYPKDYSEKLKNGEIEEISAFYTPPKRMNELLGAMLGEENAPKMFKSIRRVDEDKSNLNFSYVSEHDLYKPIKSDSDAALHYSFNAEADAIIYMYLPTDYPREADVTVNGDDRGTVLGNETNRMISLGYFKAGEKVNVTVKLKDDRIYIRSDEPLFWYIDADVYENGFASLKENQFEIENWKETRFEGTITLTEERSTVFTSIPYDKNWTVYVDGEKVDTYKLLDALVAFDAEPGTHDLVIKYVPKELYIGTAISDTSAVILAVIFICDVRRKKRKNFEVEIIELEDETKEEI